MGGGSSVGVGGWGSDAGGVRVGSGEGGAGAVGVGVAAVGWPGGVHSGVGDPIGRGVVLGSGVVPMTVAIDRGSSIPNS